MTAAEKGKGVATAGYRPPLSMHSSVPIVIGGSAIAIARAAMPLACRSERKHPNETIIEPTASMRILVSLEANEGETIHSG